FGSAASATSTLAGGGSGATGASVGPSVASVTSQRVSPGARAVDGGWLASGASASTMATATAAPASRKSAAAPRRCRRDTPQHGVEAPARRDPDLQVGDPPTRNRILHRMSSRRGSSLALALTPIALSAVAFAPSGCTPPREQPAQSSRPAPSASPAVSVPTEPGIYYTFRVPTSLDELAARVCF